MTSSGYHPDVEGLLRRLHRRLWVLSCLRAFFFSLAALLLSLVLIFLACRLFAELSGERGWLLFLGVLPACVTFLVLSFVASRASAVGLARLVERSCPDPEESLSSAVQLAALNADAVRDSLAFRRALQECAGERARQVRPARVLPLSIARRALQVFFATIVLHVALSLVPGLGYWQTLSAVLIPGSELSKESTGEHSLVDPAASPEPEAPTLLRSRKTYHFPDYLGWEPLELVEDHGHLRALRGTRIDLRFEFDRDIERATLTSRFQDESVRDLSLGVNGREARLEDFVMELPGTYELEVFASGARHDSLAGRFDLELIIDEEPGIRILSPDSGRYVVPDGRIEVSLRATDDLGLSAVEQVISINGGGPVSRALDIDTGTRNLRFGGVLLLAPLRLSPGDRLGLAYLARDLEGKEVRSRTLQFATVPAGAEMESAPAVEACRGVLTRVSELAELARRLDASWRQSERASAGEAPGAVRAFVDLARASERGSKKALSDTRAALSLVRDTRLRGDLERIHGALRAMHHDHLLATLKGATAGGDPDPRVGPRTAALRRDSHRLASAVDHVFLELELYTNAVRPLEALFARLDAWHKRVESSTELVTAELKRLELEGSVIHAEMRLIVELLGRAPQLREKSSRTTLRRVVSGLLAPLRDALEEARHHESPEAFLALRDPTLRFLTGVAPWLKTVLSEARERREVLERLAVTDASTIEVTSAAPSTVDASTLASLRQRLDDHILAPGKEATLSPGRKRFRADLEMLARVLGDLDPSAELRDIGRLFGALECSKSLERSVEALRALIEAAGPRTSPGRPWPRHSAILHDHFIFELETVLAEAGRREVTDLVRELTRLRSTIALGKLASALSPEGQDRSEPRGSRRVFPTRLYSRLDTLLLDETPGIREARAQLLAMLPGLAEAFARALESSRRASSATGVAYRDARLAEEPGEESPVEVDRLLTLETAAADEVAELRERLLNEASHVDTTRVDERRKARLGDVAIVALEAPRPSAEDFLMAAMIAGEPSDAGPILERVQNLQSDRDRLLERLAAVFSKLEAGELPETLEMLEKELGVERILGELDAFYESMEKFTTLRDDELRLVEETSQAAESGSPVTEERAEELAMEQERVQESLLSTLDDNPQGASVLEARLAELILEAATALEADAKSQSSLNLGAGRDQEQLGRSFRELLREIKRVSRSSRPSPGDARHSLRFEDRSNPRIASVLESTAEPLRRANDSIDSAVDSRSEDAPASLQRLEEARAIYDSVGARFETRLRETLEPEAATASVRARIEAVEGIDYLRRGEAALREESRRLTEARSLEDAHFIDTLAGLGRQLLVVERSLADKPDPARQKELEGERESLGVARIRLEEERRELETSRREDDILQRRGWQELASNASELSERLGLIRASLERSPEAERTPAAASREVVESLKVARSECLWVARDLELKRHGEARQRLESALLALGVESRDKTSSVDSDGIGSRLHLDLAAARSWAAERSTALRDLGTRLGDWNRGERDVRDRHMREAQRILEGVLETRDQLEAAQVLAVRLEMSMAKNIAGTLEVLSGEAIPLLRQNRVVLDSSVRLTPAATAAPEVLRRARAQLLGESAGEADASASFPGSRVGAEMAGTLSESLSNMASAAKRLEEGRLDEAVASERAAAEALQRTLRQMGEALSEARESLSDSDTPLSLAEALARGQEQPSPGSTGPPRGDHPTQADDPEGMFLGGLISGQDLDDSWARLPSKLKRELLRGYREEIPPEFRRRVEAYFRAIAEEARKD